MRGSLSRRVSKTSCAAARPVHERFAKSRDNTRVSIVMKIKENSTTTSHVTVYFLQNTYRKFPGVYFTTDRVEVAHWHPVHAAERQSSRAVAIEDWVSCCNASAHYF